MKFRSSGFIFAFVNIRAADTSVAADFFIACFAVVKHRLFSHSHSAFFLYVSFFRRIFSRFAFSRIPRRGVVGLSVDKGKVIAFARHIGDIPPKIIAVIGQLVGFDTRSTAESA